MGCEQSRESQPMKPSSSSSSNRLSSSRQAHESLPLISSDMGQPGRMTSQLSSQHERLILELLPFKDAGQFKQWLDSSYVRGSWHEFCRDFLARNPTAPECDKNKTAEAAKMAINSKSPKYLVYHPEKDGWTQEDHVVRFIVTVVSDNMLKHMWSESDWRKKNIEISKAVYEVLSFLRATDFGGISNPPGYEAAILQ